MPRVSARLLAVALCALALSPAPAGAEPIDTVIDKVGWWNRTNTTTATPAGPVSVPPPPGVPSGSLVVGLLGTQPTAIAAVGVRPAAPASTIQDFELVLEEDPEATGNLGGGDAALVACPITEFWVGGENGDWDTRPSFDCALAAGPGTRDDDGRWTFDLVPIGEAWFDPFGTIAADGVVIVPAPEATTPFQVVFRADSAASSLDGAAVPDDDAFGTPPPDVPADAGFSGGIGGGGSIFSPPSLSLPPITAPDLAEPATPTAPAPATGGVEDAAPAAATSPSRTGDILGNLPASIVLLVVLALGTLLAISYWFGPAGQPTTTVRQRGVSRALDARSRAREATR